MLFFSTQILRKKSFFQEKHIFFGLKTDFFRIKPSVAIGDYSLTKIDMSIFINKRYLFYDFNLGS